MWSVCALSIGKACAAVPAFAVVAGVQRGGLAAVFLSVVLALPAVAVFVAAGGLAGCGWCYTLAASLGALWRPVYGPCGGVAGVGLSVLLAWPLRAACRWRWCCLDWWRVVLAAVAVRAAPVAAVAVAGGPVKRARRRGPFAGRGGVALVAWSDCQRAGAAGVAGAVAVFVVAVAGIEPAPPVAVPRWSRPWPLRAVGFYSSLAL